MLQRQPYAVPERREKWGQECTSARQPQQGCEGSSSGWLTAARGRLLGRGCRCRVPAAAALAAGHEHSTAQSGPISESPLLTANRQQPASSPRGCMLALVQIVRRSQ
eukprot:COSAG01_NODE_10546_length_2135_cov_1.374263_3_plen_107_part_00